MENLNDLLTWLDKIQGLSAFSLVFLSCIVVGYGLRFIKSFPNDGIPVVVILWGALFMLFIADPRATTMPARVWTGRNLLIGLIIGCVAWFAHKLILSRIENFISEKFNLGDTTMFSKSSEGKVTQLDPPRQPDNISAKSGP